MKQAKVLHRRLEYVNVHQNCEMKQLQEKLESCRQELVKSRAERLEVDGEAENKSSDVEVKHKALEHELKMVRIDTW